MPYGPKIAGSASYKWIALVLVLTMSLLTTAPLLHAASNSQMSVQAIHDANLESLVFIQVEAKRANGLKELLTGTGFIVHPDGYVLTCSHVIPVEPDCKIEGIKASIAGRYEHAYPLTVVRRDEQGDVILLKLPQRQKPWRSLQSMADAQVGGEIVALGFPEEQDVVEVPGSIIGVHADGRWLTNTALNRGMSGGPAFDRSGAVVGIVEGGYQEAQSLNVLIPMSFSMSLLQSIHSPLLASTPTPNPSAPETAAPPDLALKPAAVPTSHALTQVKGISYVLTTTTDPVQPGEVAQFTISVHNLTDKSAYLGLAFHVPKFTEYDRLHEGAATGFAGRWVDAGASVSDYVDLKVLGGDRSPPDGSIITMVITDPQRGASVSLSTTVNAAPVATLDLSTSPGTVAPGEAFSYSLAYYNASKETLAGAQLSMTVPVGASLVSTDGGGVLGADHAVHWPLGTVVAGATGQVNLNLKASIAKGNLTALLVQAALRDGGGHVLAQASACKAVYAAPTFSYVLTTTTDPVQPGEVAQFTISVHNLTDKSAYLELAFHVPKFTEYDRLHEGAATGFAGRWVDADASVSDDVDLKVLGGNRSPPDGSIITLAMTDLKRGALVSFSVGVNKAITMFHLGTLPKQASSRQ
jgi:S1-C subfamily serine protease